MWVRVCVLVRMDIRTHICGCTWVWVYGPSCVLTYVGKHGPTPELTILSPDTTHLSHQPLCLKKDLFQGGDVPPVPYSAGSQ